MKIVSKIFPEKFFRSSRKSRETYVVLLTELLGERGAHDDTTLVRGSLEVSGTALASGRRDLYNSVSKTAAVRQDLSRRTLVDLDHFGGC